MFCPTCGAESQRANAYCKRCGEWLPDIKARTRNAFGGQTPQQNVFTGLFMSALSALVALFSAIALYATYLGTDEAKWSVYLAAGFCLCIAGWQTSSFLVGLRLRGRFKRAREGVDSPGELELKQPMASINAAEMSPSLNAGDMSPFVSAPSAPSVTENTTELLQPIGRVRDHERNG